MTLYEMPAQSSYQKPFRIFSGVAIVLLLGILGIATYNPQWLRDETREILAWLAGAIVIAAVMIGARLGTKEGLWKLKQGYRVEVSDGKIIQKRLGWPVVEIPIDQIESLHESRGGWLIIKGGEPARQLAVPSEIIGFDSLERELTANRTVSPFRVKFSPSQFLPSASLILACFFLLTSHSRAVVMTAGGAALLLQGFAIYSLRRLVRPNLNANFVILTYILTFLILAWIVWARAKATI